MIIWINKLVERGFSEEEAHVLVKGIAAESFSEGEENISYDEYRGYESHQLFEEWFSGKLEPKKLGNLETGK